MFLCMWFLPAICGVNALFWGMGLCMCVSGALNFFMLKRKTKIKLKISKSLIGLCLITIPSAAIVSFVAGLCDMVMPQIFSILISCAFGVIFYVLLCMIFNIVDVKGYYDMFTSKFKKKNKNLAKA